MYENKPSIDELMHYGMPRRSGRYPWGSGKDPYQHCTDFLSRVKYLSDNGISDEEIIKRFLCLMELRNRNKEKIIEKLENMSGKYEVI